jgi:hypothetical protein
MRTKLVYAAALLFVTAMSSSWAQEKPQLTLRHLTRPAGYIFVGRVKSVRYLPRTRSRHVATVRVRFQVEQGFRGVRSGRELVIRQWAGLWNAGERYRTGERVLLFLYPASKLGLTSPVGGARGRFSLDRNGQVLLGVERAALFSDQVQRPRRDRIPLREFVRGVRRIEEE